MHPTISRNLISQGIYVKQSEYQQFLSETFLSLDMKASQEHGIMLFFCFDEQISFQKSFHSLI